MISALTGCGGFFVPPNNGGGGGGGGTTTGRVYVANAKTATTSTISGFTIGTGTLTAVNGSPFTLNYVPVALAISPNNSYLYAAGPSSINVYSINSDGSLTQVNGGAVISVASLDISPDGQWLFGLDQLSNVLDEFQINSSTGALTPVASNIQYPVPSGTTSWPRMMVKVAPSGNYVFAALGTIGDIVFSLNTTTGATSWVQQLRLNSSSTSDNALAVDSTGSYLYIARSGTNGGVAVYTIGANGVLNSISGSPFAAGSQPFSVTLDTTGKYLYVANRNAGTISGYSIGTGSALTALNGSPYASGTQVNSLGVDKSGKYLLAGAGGGGPDLSMYSFDATTLGKLNLTTSVATDTDPAGVVAIAVTH
ncbi:lactonase family protein [Edaphobacter albus]|uniref:lactonase family protein n=1 Tax=Edaphobacter sp. 4G125 TaxID=2763071 RepID=UPI00164631A0|nr:beta-propeller fold lactonase family protein [Edaphobacter sp. 4G125]QNI37928.1 beta-propeller fold lactonase family protein [Edaphobacter sp. 4G125]